MLLMEDGREIFDSLGQLAKAEIPMRVMVVGRSEEDSEVHPENV